MPNSTLPLLVGLLALAACKTTTPEPGTPEPIAAGPAASFTVNGGRFSSERITIASPSDASTRPGAAIGFWSQRPTVGTELDAKSEKPIGLLLHVPAADREKTGTFPLFAGAVNDNGINWGSDIVLTSGSVTIVTYGKRLVGTFTAQGYYIDFPAGQKKVDVTLTGGTFDLLRGSDR